MNTAGIKARRLEDWEQVADQPEGICLSEDRLGKLQTGGGTLVLLLSQAPRRNESSASLHQERLAHNCNRSRKQDVKLGLAHPCHLYHLGILSPRRHHQSIKHSFWQSSESFAVSVFLHTALQAATTSWNWRSRWRLVTISAPGRSAVFPIYGVGCSVLDSGPYNSVV